MKRRVFMVGHYDPLSLKQIEAMIALIQTFHLTPKKKNKLTVIIRGSDKNRLFTRDLTRWLIMQSLPETMQSTVKIKFANLSGLDKKPSKSIMSYKSRQALREISHLRKVADPVTSDIVGDIDYKFYLQGAAEPANTRKAILAMLRGPRIKIRDPSKEKIWGVPHENTAVVIRGSRIRVGKLTEELERIVPQLVAQIIFDTRGHLMAHRTKPSRKEIRQAIESVAREAGWKKAAQPLRPTKTPAKPRGKDASPGG